MSAAQLTQHEDGLRECAGARGQDHLSVCRRGRMSSHWPSWTAELGSRESVMFVWRIKMMRHPSKRSVGGTVWPHE